MKFPRSSGILLHPTSLPGRFGIGDLGGEAYRFIDFLAAGKLSLWQTLPLTPPGFGHSPYQSFSAFAGNILMISPEKLVGDWLLSNEDIQAAPDFPEERIDWNRVIEFKSALLEKAFQNFRRGEYRELREDLEGFRHYAQSWLADYALFAALKDEHEGREWNTWEKELIHREPSALKAARERLRDRIEAHELFQYLFFKQWLELKRYANERGIKIIGDMPIFVAHNSADVWAHPRLFKLDEEENPTVVAGVPPDLFSKTGQRWGNPIYNWERMREDGFKWWIERMREAFKIVDIVRIDHFRGFAATWEVPAEDETAENGEWVEVPGRELFAALKESLGDVPVMAEDLGTITPDVIELRDELGFPGMRVLQFAFNGDPRDTHLPHNYVHNTVVYTGTHDNDTVVGWFHGKSGDGSTRTAEQIKRERANCKKYLHTTGREINWDFIRAAFSSVADVAIIPLQDILGLDSSARMNTPAVEEGNWAWRYKSDALTSELSERLLEMTKIYGREVW
ncbi:MAG TPA: 4-alpha-glucanotransferase [Blastocatellia bacterium]|nr:4-alpha-glucanotransferase [Blastocatellia bacterium]